jgi:ligand-binding sensor domain-containing protein
LNSFFVKNKSIYLATKNGIWFSENLFNGNFQQLNLFNNENILSLKLLGNLFYVMKNDGLYLINIYDYISNFLELKLNHSSAINSKEVKQVFVNKNKILAIQNDQLMSSSDNGKNFNNIILSKNNIKSNFIFPFGDSLYLATNKGLFVSNNNDNIFDINLDNRFYNYITNYKNKLLLSSNDGVYELLNNGSIHKVNSLKTNKIYSFNDNIYFITNKRKLLKSDDGINYNEIYKEIIKEEKILSLFFDNENLYVGTDNGLFIFYNNDKYFKKYLISDINLNINHINSIQKFGSMLYLATNSGIAISEDGGESFKVLGEEGGLGAEKINDIYLNFSNSQSVSLSFYLATEKGLFVSNL